jgi:hypothetical protein
MHQRVKVFSFVTGHGETVLEPPLEEHVNNWLANLDGNVLRVSQSESERTSGHHVTLCIWYVPAATGPAD